MSTAPRFHSGLTQQMCLAADDIYISKPSTGTQLIGVLMREGDDYVIYASMPFRYFGKYSGLDALRDGMFLLKAANGGGHG
jgi:hypothetical protein